MLNLETKLIIDKDFIESANLCDRLTEGDLNRLGAWAMDGYTVDKNSRYNWEQRMAAAMRVAMQVTSPKSFPWRDASNVAFPLVTIGALQFHSHAYPAIINGSTIVKYKVHGVDPQGQKHEQARRIGEHMSYQLLEQDSAWEEQHDRMMLVLAIVGVAFKKSYYSGSKRHNLSELVMAENLVMDYYAKSVETCSRKTHVIPMTRNEIYERIQRGVFVDVREDPWYKQPANGMANQERDTHTGQTSPQPDETTPYKCLEQHCLIDLDQDGYAEPYIITVEESSHRVLRLVARFESEDDIERSANGEIITIRATEYFTKYGLIPAPDGSVYDIGFGVLLGPLNNSVSSLVNQLIDAGTMANSGGGFLGRGAKLRSGSYAFSPLEWKRVDSTADDLRKSIFPLPVREPSPVLFQLLSLLIDYSQRISGATDMISGINPGQNTPAETSRNMITQGSKIFSAIHKRIWRSMKEEYRKLFILNGRHLPVYGDMASREDYLGDPNLVTPSAAPYIITDEQTLAQARELRQAAAGSPGYNKEAVERLYLRAMKVEDIGSIYPGAQATGPLPNPKMQLEQAKLQIQQAKLKLDQEEFIITVLEQRKLNLAKIHELEARSIKEMAEAHGIGDGHKIAAFNAQLGAMKAQDEAMKNRVELMMKGMESAKSSEQDTNRSGLPGMDKPSSDQAPAPVSGAAGGGS